MYYFHQEKKKKIKDIDLKTYSTENKPEIESMFICTKHINRNQRAKAAPPPKQNHQNRFYHHLQSEYKPVIINKKQATRHQRKETNCSHKFCLANKYYEKVMD